VRDEGTAQSRWIPVPQGAVQEVTSQLHEEVEVKSLQGRQEGRKEGRTLMCNFCGCQTKTGQGYGGSDKKGSK
jgi:hypothetical protein